VARAKKFTRPTKPPSRLPLHEGILKHYLLEFTPLFENWQESGNFPQSILLTGTKGNRKEDFAHYLCQWLNCHVSSPKLNFSPESETFNLFGEEPNVSKMKNPTPCGVCPECKRALGNNWIDVINIRPESAVEGRAGLIRIDALVPIQSTLGFGPSEAPFKIILIEKCETMTTQAANALLKTLEEPMKDWIFILTASDTTRVPSTIMSRCQRFNSAPLSVALTKSILIRDGVEEEKANLIAHLSSGNLDKAADMAEGDYWNHRQNIAAVLSNSNSAANTLIEFAGKNVAHLNQIIDQLELIVKDGLLLVTNQDHSNTQPHLVNKDLETSINKFIKSSKKHQTSLFWFDRFRDIQEIRHKIHAPLNRKILSQELIIPWLSLQEGQR